MRCSIRVRTRFRPPQCALGAFCRHRDDELVSGKFALTPRNGVGHGAAVPLANVSHPRENSFVLSEDDVPAVIAPDVLAAVAAQGTAQLLVTDEQLEALHELVAIGVVQAAVAAYAVLHEDRAAR